MKSGVSQKSVKSLFANAPKKKPEPAKPAKPAELAEPKDDDLFDQESEDDVIAVRAVNPYYFQIRNRSRNLALQESEEETPETPELKQEDEPVEKKSQKRPKEPVAGAMLKCLHCVMNRDQFAKKTNTTKMPPSPAPGKRFVKKLREVTEGDYSCRPERLL